MSNQNFKTGTIADVGYAEYKGKETFYLVLQDDKGNLADPIRGKGLEEAFNKAGDLKKGDVVNLKDFGIDEDTKKRIWEIERHEPHQDLSNEISQDNDFAQEADKFLDKKDIKLQDFEYVPDSIKNNYVGITKNRFMSDEKINYYDKNDKQQIDIAFEDRKNSLNTSRQDDKTIHAMLDLAESKGWTAIKLKGTEEFKQKAWLEASLRGIATKGYQPSERDLAMLEASKKERSINTVIAEKLQEPVREKVEEAKSNQTDIQAPTTLEKMTEIDVVEHEKVAPKKTEKEIKQEIKTLIQNGVRDGSIKERSDIIEKLKENGFNVIRENEKSITLSNPNGKDIRLDGELFTKNYNALKSLNESLKPENVKEKYPQMSDENIAKVNLWRENVLSRYDTNEARQNAMSRLNNVLPDVASGKLELGYPIPPNEIKPEIEVRVPDSGDQSRSR